MLYLLFSLLLLKWITCYPFSDEIHEFGVSLNMSNIDVVIQYANTNISFTQFILLQPDQANITMHMRYKDILPETVGLNVHSDDGYDAVYLAVYNYVGISEESINDMIDELSRQGGIGQNEYGDYNIVLLYNALNPVTYDNSSASLNKRYCSDDRGGTNYKGAGA